MSINSDVNDLIRRLRMVSETSKRQTSRILGKNAKPIADALFAAAPHGKKVHKRYKKAGLNKSIRTPRGKGQVVAIYKPGNLATSFKLFRFKRAKYNIQVGAKFEKNGIGEFGPFGKQDAYYAHIVEKRDPFIIPTWLRMKNTVETGIIKSLQRVIKRAAKKNG